MTLLLPAELHDDMLAHCREDHPREACGVLAGHHDRPLWARRMANVADDPRTRFAFDPDEQVELYRGLDEHGLEPTVIYHSHPATAAVPSGTDRACAREARAHYVIVGTDGVRSWRLDGGLLVEEPVEVMAPCG